MKIFISFSDLPILIQQNKIEFANLQTGLFFFFYDLKQVFSPLPPRKEISDAYKLSRMGLDQKTYEKLQRTSPIAARIIVNGCEEDYCQREIILFSLQELLKKALIEGRLHLRDDNSPF